MVPDFRQIYIDNFLVDFHESFDFVHLYTLQHFCSPFELENICHLAFEFPYGKMSKIKVKKSKQAVNE